MPISQYHLSEEDRGLSPAEGSTPVPSFSGPAYSSGLAGGFYRTGDFLVFSGTITLTLEEV